MAEATPKQIIYQEMFEHALVHLRARAALPWWSKAKDRSAYYETDLLHNLPASMLEPEFVAHDIWFLNAQAKHYYFSCNSRLSPLYSRQIESLRKLFALVPEGMRNELHWEGPRADSSG